LSVNPELPARLARVVHRMLEKDPARRGASMEGIASELELIHAALRRSRSRSALPPRGALGPASRGGDGRVRTKELLARGSRHFKAGRWREAAAEMNEVLRVDPDSEEAAEVLWRVARNPRRGQAVAPSPEQEARVAALLTRVAPGVPEGEARKALAELALIAPDDPRLADLLRERAAPDVDTPGRPDLRSGLDAPKGGSR
jgi:hypothetical protein